MDDAQTYCQNKVASLCSPLPVRFSPAERFSLVSEWSRKFRNLGQFEKILCELPETQPSLQGTRFA